MTVKKGARKIAQRKPAKSEQRAVVLVGTYRGKQLAWIRENGIYNYPIKDENVGSDGQPSAGGKGTDLSSFGSLADYLPTELAKIPRNQLRVREAAMQLEFSESIPTTGTFGASVCKETVRMTIDNVDFGGRNLGKCKWFFEDGVFIRSDYRVFGVVVEQTNPLSAINLSTGILIGNKIATVFLLCDASQYSNRRLRIPKSFRDRIAYQSVDEFIEQNAVPFVGKLGVK